MAKQTGQIVVGYDGSTKACSAVEWAADEAARRGSGLTVFYLVDYGGSSGVKQLPRCGRPTSR
jgi:nucleotide-binding universal stress UspA family protein